MHDGYVAKERESERDDELDGTTTPPPAYIYTNQNQFRNPEPIGRRGQFSCQIRVNLLIGTIRNQTTARNRTSFLA